MQPRKLAIANQKGGVGKTATTLGLASAVSARGGKALVVDVDPQGNATSGLGTDVDAAASHLSSTAGLPTTYELMNKTQPGSAADAVIATEWDGIDLIPADAQLSKIEADGSNDLVFRLDVAFEGLDLSPYDLVLFDCGPSLGKILFSALIAADGVIAVTDPTIDSLKGVENLEETIVNVQRRPNPQLVFDRIVISRRRNTGEHIFREQELRDTYGDLVARSVIPELSARQDAHSIRQPIHQFRGGRSLTLQTAYSDLLTELLTPTGVAQ